VSLHIDEAWMVVTLMLWVRLAALLVLSPLVTAAKMPATVVVLLTLVLAGLMSAGQGLRFERPMTVPDLALGALAELGIGALMGFALRCAFAAFSLAGRVLDVQMGFGIGAVFDPVSQSGAPVLGSALGLLAMALFFAVDGHHALVRGVAFSASVLPPGQAWVALTPAALLRPFGAIFSVGVSIVAPAIFVLLLTDLVLGVVSRVLPQMNVFFVGIPVKILVGLGVLALTASGIGPAMSGTYAGIFRFWDEVLR